MSNSNSNAVVIIGGHGNVALHLAKKISSKHKVVSVIRTSEQSEEISAVGAIPEVLSLEDDTKEAFTKLFEKHGAGVVVFSAGAGGKGGEERTKKVDYEGAIKIFDAIEGVPDEKRPRLILISAVDIRDPNKIPSHYVSPPIKVP
jgi:nucleoside-diphosphate-sugar epimerase